MYWINATSFRPYRAEFYSLSNRLLKTCRYEEFQQLLGVMRPTRLVMEDALRKGEESVLEKLRRIERSVSSCDGGCASSFPSKGRPWVGCSASAWPIGSATCKNGRKYKTYVECTEASYFLAWKPMEVWWYCSSLAFNK